MFRASWDGAPPLIQWNVGASAAGVLRGVHVHLRHTDYLVVVGGRMNVGLCDLRPGSPTAGLATLLELRHDALTALCMPPGVAHGFFSPAASTFVYGLTEYWDPTDDVGIFWSDPQLGIPWGDIHPTLSERDAKAPLLADVSALLRRISDS
jgi:dTDP-4-dehydrorhamnose 3,5-epimerase